MKCFKIIIIAILLPTKCLGQVTVYASFTPNVSTYFIAPIGSSVTLNGSISWSVENWKLDPYPPSPSFRCDSSINIYVSQVGRGSGSGSETLNITISSDTPRCYIPPGDGIYAYYDSDSVYQGDPLYALQGLFYDPKVIGKLIAPDSLYCGSVPVDSLTGVRLSVTLDSLGAYRQIKVLSVNEPFSLDDTIEMNYPCFAYWYYYNNTNNCYFHPTHSGHYVDTAKLLDELTNDTISVVLIGDAYDAGVDDVPTPQVKLFPNPCDRELQIDIPSEAVSQIKIYDLFGDRIYSSNTHDNTATIDCSQIPAGVYFVSIDGMTSPQKLIVAH